MTTREYSLLIAMQDSLHSEGPTQQEIKAAHHSDGTITLDGKNVPSVRGKVSKSVFLLAFGQPPRGITDLSEEEFDFKISGEISGAIDPDDFLGYNILADTQRLAAMLGRNQAFEQAKDQLVKRAYADPAIEMYKNGHL